MTNIKFNISSCLSKNVEDKLDTVIYTNVSDEVRDKLRKIKGGLWLNIAVLARIIRMQENNFINKTNKNQREK